MLLPHAYHPTVGPAGQEQPNYDGSTSREQWLLHVFPTSAAACAKVGHVSAGMGRSYIAGSVLTFAGVACIRATKVSLNSMRWCRSANLGPWPPSNSGTGAVGCGILDPPIFHNGILNGPELNIYYYKGFTLMGSRRVDAGVPDNIHLLGV